MAKKKRKIVYVDMDGVLCSFEKGVLAYEPDMCWDRENVDRVCEANPNVFLTLPLIEGAVEAVEKLRDLGYLIYFLSTPMHNIPESFMDKQKWIVKNFGSWASRHLILTHRKDLNIGDYLIDDRLVNGAAEFTGEHIHFGTEKFPNWEHIYNYLKQLHYAPRKAASDIY